MSSKPTTDTSSGTRSPRRLAVSSAPLGRHRPGFDREVAVHDNRLAFGPLLLGARHRAAQAIAAQWADQRAGDDADAAMSEPIEVVHRFEGGGGVVDVD